MAITLTYIGAVRTVGMTRDIYNWTASSSGDTVSLTATGRILSVEFFDANGNFILTTPPTMGTVAAGTTAGTNTGLITANNGGVVTNGCMIVTHAGL